MPSPRPTFVFVFTLAAVLAPSGGVWAGGVPRAECFPVENLPAGSRAEAEALLTRMLDGEALYTLAGGLKPMSDGFWRATFPEADATSPAVEGARRGLAALRCGDEFAAGVYVFARAYDGKRHADALVVHRPSLRAAIARHPTAFAAVGVGPATGPAEVLARVDRAAPADRWRAFGLLYGYPEHAVEFFVAAGEAQRRTRAFVERDFIRLPTFRPDDGRFVYAVPKGHAPDAADEALRTKAERIFKDFRGRRGAYVGDGKPGAAFLLRDWFDDGTGRCRPPYDPDGRPRPPAEITAPAPPACGPTRAGGTRCRHWCCIFGGR